MKAKKKWNELAIMVKKLHEIKQKITIDYFWHIRHKCAYNLWDSTKTHYCAHKKHFETSTGKTFCTMDECPILRELLEEME